MQDLVRLIDLNYTYQEGTFGLSNINIDIKEGELVVLIGKSGSGKSTITKTINGLIPHFYPGQKSGQIWLDGQAIDSLKIWEIGEKVGNVFQDPRSQFFANEVAGEIAFACENYGLSRPQIVERVQKSAESMDMAHMLADDVHSLSYGMRQKLAIASARAGNPKVYLMDEPSANLDMEGTELLRTMIAQLKAEGMTVVIAEHRLYYLRDIADRFIELRDGAVARVISPAEFKQMSSDVMKVEGLRIQDLRDLAPKKKKARPPETILEVNGLTKSFKHKQVLKQISFDLRRGEILGIVGTNGTGKSTLGKSLAGLLKTDGGEIIFRNKKLSKRQRMGKIWYIPQDLDSQLFGENLIDELLTVAKDRKADRTRALEIIQSLDLADCIEKHPSTLSGGQKQRLALGVSMMADTQLLILDEPTSGLDGDNMRRISQLIQDQAKAGKSFLVITHDAEFCWNVCDRVMCLEEGQVRKQIGLEEPKEFLDLIKYGENT